MKHYSRPFELILKNRLKEKPRFIQTVLGPRQVGKTSGVLRVLEKNFSAKDYEYFTAENHILEADWFFQQVQKATENNKKIIVFDEIQKMPNWSELVKQAWDNQKKQKKLMHWVLLGSSSLKLSQGLSESLAGRFEIISAPHWSYKESQVGFKIGFDNYLKSGGYPAAYSLLKDPSRFKKYMLDAVFETVVSRDIFHYATIKKPALFRQTFILASQYPAQEVSYNKLLGQLQEAGNVDQIKHYLDLFTQAFLLKLVFKYSKSPLSRLSSPKIISCAPVFNSLFLKRELTPEEKGRVFESVVGSQLCEHFDSVYYWRDGRYEVDYIVETDGVLYAVEVKTKTRKSSGYLVFKKSHANAKFCMIDFENFQEFEKSAIDFLKKYSI